MKKAKLPAQFKDNLEQIATGLHGKPITVDFAREWKISEANAKLLLEYMYQSGLVEIAWLNEMQELCYIKKNCTLN